MCLIVDANAATLVFAPKGDNAFKPVREALLARKAVAVYGGGLRREYLRTPSIRPLLVELDRQGSLRLVSDETIDRMTQSVVDEGLCLSDDPHVIALARVSATRLLCSHDETLHADFTNRKILQPAGKVYQNESHRHLIRRYCGKAGRATHRRRGVR
jgi:hypothetical protein